MSAVVNVSSSQPPHVASAVNPFLDRLARRVAATGTYLCLGIDPEPAGLPLGFSPDAAGIEAFSRLLIEVAAPHASAIKANVAFFEAFGSQGVAALERLRAAVPADIPFIADAKRGDIGSTASRQAVALFDVLGADAVTANPYLGREAIAPLLERSDRFVFVLCRTSNPGAGEFQNLVLQGGEPLYVHVARSVAEWQQDGAPVGLVAGATAADDLAVIRSAAPDLAFLIPGVGAQGGDIDAVLANGPAQTGQVAGLRGGGLLVNVSRGIAAAALESGDPGELVSQAAQGWARRLEC